MSRCARPGCEGVVAHRGVFCPDCHIALPRYLTSLIYRTKVCAERAENDSDRAHLTEQTAGYISSAVRSMGWDRPDAAQP